MKTHRQTLALVFCLLANAWAAAASAQDASVVVTPEIAQVMEQVRAIVNQPVTALPREPGMQVSEFSPGWFHDGAITPDFEHVDVRTTQETPYDAHEYVSSDVSPGLVFHGHDLEFNANTKYFYADRTRPKKKLTDTEMLEINRLYRVIGELQQGPAWRRPKALRIELAVLLLLAIGLLAKQRRA